MQRLGVELPRIQELLQKGAAMEARSSTPRDQKEEDRVEGLLASVRRARDALLHVALEGGGSGAADLGGGEAAEAATGGSLVASQGNPAEEAALESRRPGAAQDRQVGGGKLETTVGSAATQCRYSGSGSTASFSSNNPGSAFGSSEKDEDRDRGGLAANARRPSSRTSGKVGGARLSLEGGAERDAPTNRGSAAAATPAPGPGGANRPKRSSLSFWTEEAIQAVRPPPLVPAIFP